jgi:hypothetical protein
MSDAIFVTAKASGRLKIGDRKEIDKAAWRKPRGIRLTPTSRYIRDKLFPMNHAKAGAERGPDDGAGALCGFLSSMIVRRCSGRHERGALPPPERGKVGGKLWSAVVAAALKADPHPTHVVRRPPPFRGR